MIDHAPLLKPVVVEPETATRTIYDMEPDALTRMTDFWLDRSIDNAINNVGLYQMRVIMVPSALPILRRHKRALVQLMDERERRQSVAKEAATSDMAP